MVHDLRAKIMTRPTYKEGSILGAILFEDTINRDVDGIPTCQYLWDKKKVVPFLKSDVGLAPAENGVQKMKDHPGLEDMLAGALLRAAGAPSNALRSRPQIQKASRRWSRSSSTTASGPSPREWFPFWNQKWTSKQRTRPRLRTCCSPNSSRDSRRWALKIR